MISVRTTCPICHAHFKGEIIEYCSSVSSHFETFYNGYGDVTEKFWIKHHNKFIYIRIDYHKNTTLIKFNDDDIAIINSTYYPNDNIQEYFLNLYLRYKKLLPFQ